VAKHRKYEPKHRTPKPGPGLRVPVVRASGRAVRNTVVLTSLAAAATGSVVTGGVLLSGANAPVVAAGDLAFTGAAPGSSPSPDVAEALASRRQTISRSDRRAETDPDKAAALSASDRPADTRTEDLSGSDPRIIAQALLAEYGFSSDQFSCLDSLYVSESNWRIDADNPSSSAYGIPQALTQLHDMPAGYMTSAEVQIRWGLEYIQRAYGTPCGAWSFKQSHGWY
jgi:hypothetical protein